MPSYSSLKDVYIDKSSDIVTEDIMDQESKV